MVECLRIRPSIPVREKPPITAKRLVAAQEQIRAGTYSVAKLRANFALTTDQQTAINDFEKELA